MAAAPLPVPSPRDVDSAAACCSRHSRAPQAPQAHPGALQVYGSEALRQVRVAHPGVRQHLQHDVCLLLHEVLQKHLGLCGAPSRLQHLRGDLRGSITTADHACWEPTGRLLLDSTALRVKLPVPRPVAHHPRRHELRYHRHGLLHQFE